MLVPTKPAFLLMGYGSPNSLDEVGDYLSEVRGGRKPTAGEVEALKERYRLVGGRTPLLDITRSQANALEGRLREEGLADRVYVGMKHWHPFIEESVQRIVQDGAPAIVGIALAPHYSRLSINGYEEKVRRGLEKLGADIPFVMVRNWHREQSLIKALTTRVQEGLNKLEEPQTAVLLFTAHSLPKKAVAPDDPYEAQLLETSRLVAQSSGVEVWDFAFQSAGEPRNNWLGPQILEQIASLRSKGFEEILVCPVGFVSDHLEILYDLDIQARQYAASLGARLERTVSLNDDPEFINCLASVARSAVRREVPVFP